MNLDISSATRQLMEEKIKVNLAVVYPNIQPNVLTLEVRMIESKSFATAKSRANYFINVSTYIAIHKERVDGTQYTKRIPKFTRQEETSRCDRVRELISAGEENLRQNANGPRDPQQQIFQNGPIWQVGEHKQGFLLQDRGSCERELPPKIACNQVRPFHSDHRTPSVSSAQEELAALVTSISALQQQETSTSASRNMSYPKQYSDRVVQDPACAAVGIEEARGSKSSPELASSQQGRINQETGAKQFSSHVTGLRNKCNAVTFRMPSKTSKPDLSFSREKQELLANWITFQRDFGTRLDRVIPILETLFAQTPTENEKKLLRNIQLIRNVLQNSPTELAESKSANMNYGQYITMTRQVFRKYSKYEHMTLAQVAKESKSRNISAKRSLSEQNSVNPFKSVQRRTRGVASGSGSSVPTVDIGGQVRSSRENLKATAQQSSDTGNVSTNDQMVTTDRTEVRQQQILNATQLVNCPDPKRVQAVVQRHIKTTAQNNIQEHLAVEASSQDNPQQTAMAAQKINDPKEEVKVQNTMKFTEFQKGSSVTSSLLDGKHIRQCDEARDKARPFARNVVTGNVIKLTPEHGDEENRSTDNQREQLQCPGDGNVDTRHVNVQITHAETQQSEDAVAGMLNQETILENSGKVDKKSGTSQALDILEKEMERSVHLFREVSDREPILNGSILENERDTRTDEEVLSDLQDLFDGKRPKKRSSRVEETLPYMESYGKEHEDRDIADAEQFVKNQKTLTLREQVELDCEIVQNRNDSVYCHIQEGEPHKLSVTCNLNMKEYEIPTLTISVFEGYPSQGTVHYNLETPSAGWVWPFDIMRSQFIDITPSDIVGGFGVIFVVEQWLAVVESVLLFQ